MNDTVGNWIDALRASDLFCGLDNRQLARVASIATRLNVPQGHVLGRQGAVGSNIYVVLDGMVGVPSPTAQRSALILSSFDVYGHATLVPPYQHLGSAITSSPCELLMIHSVALRELLASDAEMGRAVYEALSTEMIKRFAQVIADARGQQPDNYLSV